MNKYAKKLIGFINSDYLYLIFLLSFVSVFGSLFFQFVVNLEPCSLCVIQRYFMYPLLPITAILILLKKKINTLFFLIFTIPGALVALYHVYIQETGGHPAFLPCDLVNPCNVKDIVLFGFLTIPMLSAVAFLFISVMAFAIYKLNPHDSLTKKVINGLSVRFSTLGAWISSKTNSK